MPSILLDGKQIDLFGLAVAHVNRFQVPHKGLEKEIKDISGRKCDDSSPSIFLQQSLESKLHLRLAEFGSPECVLTWKHWDMPLGLPICALRASGHHTSGKGYSLWPTPHCMRGGSTSRGGIRKTELLIGGIVKSWIIGKPPIMGMVQMGKKGELNPELNRWLMGFPRGWSSYADMEMP